MNDTLTAILKASDRSAHPCRQRRYQLKHAALGLCYFCSRAVVPGRKECRKHLLVHRRMSRERARERTRKSQ